MQPPEGPPVCTALNFLPSGIPPPISKTISRSVIPMGTSTSPVFCTRPARAKTFVPLLFSVPISAYHSPPLRMMGATLAKVSTLLIRVGCSQKPFDRGIRRPRTRRAALAFDRGDQRRFLAANECACPQPDFDPEIETGAANSCPAARSLRLRIATRKRLMASGYSART